MVMSRYSDERLVECEDCGWEGRIADCVHTYKGIIQGDVEPVDVCPKCGSEYLMEIQGRALSPA